MTYTLKLTETEQTATPPQLASVSPRIRNDLMGWNSKTFSKFHVLCSQSSLSDLSF